MFVGYNFPKPESVWMKSRAAQFLTAYRIDTPEPITKKLSLLITSATPTALPNLVHIRPRGLLDE